MHHVEGRCSRRAHAQARAVDVEEIDELIQRVIEHEADLIRLEAKEGRGRYFGELIECCQHDDVSLVDRRNELVSWSFDLPRILLEDGGRYGFDCRSRTSPG